MFKKQRLWVLVAALCLSACSGGADFGVPVAGGVEFKGRVQVDGRQHDYFLFVPSQDVLDDDVALVLNLHGGGSSIFEYESFTRMRLSAIENGFAVLSPEGFQRTWNAGGCCDPAAEQEIDHVRVLRAMISEAKDTIDIDAGRVYATGHSNGGMMAYRLACEASDVIAAIAPVSAFQMDEDLAADSPAALYNCNPARQVPVLHLHGLSDNCAPFNGGQSAGPEGGQRPPVEDAISEWRSRNQCADSSRTDRYGIGARCQIWDSCSAASEVQLCTINNAGHIWPGTDENPLAGTYGGQGSDAIDANDLIWAFFRRFRI